MAEKRPARERAQKSTRDGFTDEERAALKELTAAEEARIAALVKKAVS
jgi:hypothetical protein